ncbi:hypothetical protein L1275_001989 [Flavobacterium sp. HSC-61S13]|nr:hypothetical protein [Flavobacterium sp. HSC-61S13]
MFNKIVTFDKALKFKKQFILVKKVIFLIR